MTPEGGVPEQEPCEWCLGNVPALLLCRCTYDCGEPDCAAKDRAGEQPPVPTFDEAIAERIEQIDQARTPPPDVPTVTDPDAAIDRVLALHSKCDCKACASGLHRVGCKGCHEFWPCPTVNTIRGFHQASWTA